MTESDIPWTGPLELLPWQIRALNAYDRLLSEGISADLSYVTTPKFYVRKEINEQALRRAVAAVVRVHESLRSTFHKVNGRWHARVEAASGAVKSMEVNCTLDQCGDAVAALVEQDSCNWSIGDPGLFRLLHIRLKNASVVVTIVHHLVSDDVSERIIAEDLWSAYTQALMGTALCLPPIATPLHTYSKSARPIDVGGLLSDNRAVTRKRRAVSMEIPNIGVANGRVGRARETLGILTAFGRMATGALGTDACIDVAYHGRSQDCPFDLSRTVGLLSYYVSVSASDCGNRGAGASFLRRATPSVGLSPISLNYRRMGGSNQTIPTMLPRMSQDILRRASGLPIPLRNCLYGAQTRWNIMRHDAGLSCLIDFDPSLFDDDDIQSMFARFATSASELLSQR